MTLKYRFNYLNVRWPMLLSSLRRRILCKILRQRLERKACEMLKQPMRVLSCCYLEL